MAQGTQTVVGTGTSYTRRCCFVASSDSLVNLKQRFMKFIHKALNHKSQVISSVAKLSIQNPRSNCVGNYCHVRYDTTYTRTCLLVLLAA